MANAGWKGAILETGNFREWQTLGGKEYTRVRELYRKIKIPHVRSE